jgi:mannitol-1-phosphate 5-dehydrogenase
MSQEGRELQIVIIGAGATGRGQIGRLAHLAGFAVTFIERKRDLTVLLRSARKYIVGLAGESVREIPVENFEIIPAQDIKGCARSIAGADIVATAVLPTNLESAAPILAAGFAQRQAEGNIVPLNVIACENMERSSTALRSCVRKFAPNLDWQWIDEHVGFPDSMVACLVPQPADPLFLLSEPVQEWSVDARAVKRPMPELDGMTLADDQGAALERKFYIKNTGHFAMGIAGYLRGYRLMHEAAGDAEVFALAEAVTRESAAAVACRHGFDSRQTEEYRAGFLEALRSPLLPDEVTRVIRELKRKLSREERLVGPALLALEQGREPQALAEAIARAFTLANPRDPQSGEVQALVDSEGIARAVTHVCGLPPGHRLANLVGTAFDRLQAGSPLIRT